MPLVIERKPGQIVCIGPDITVTVVEVRSQGRVRVRIEAPRDVKILRSELVKGRADLETVKTVYGTLPIGEQT